MLSDWIWNPLHRREFKPVLETWWQLVPRKVMGPGGNNFCCLPKLACGQTAFWILLFIGKLSSPLSLCQKCSLQWAAVKAETQGLDVLRVCDSGVLSVLTETRHLSSDQGTHQEGLARMFPVEDEEVTYRNMFSLRGMALALVISKERLQNLCKIRPIHIL